MNIKLLAIDIAKNVFQLHGVDDKGKGILKKTVNRGELPVFIANLPVTVIIMEACSGASYWARNFQKLGHTVKLISPQFVTPFVKTNKNDVHDAQAIAEAASRPDMRFVAMKSLAQQDIQIIHRIRSRLVKQQTALGNQIRGILTEYGIVIVKNIGELRKRLPLILEDANNELTAYGRELCHELYEELCVLATRVKQYDLKLKHIYQHHPICQKIAAIEGVGVMTATAILTVLGDPKLFSNGRHFAAFLGLVPRQYSSGGKHRLLGISKRGDCYLRTLLIHGARAVVHRIADKTDSRSEWLRKLKERRGSNRTCVALANKNARIIWALVANDSTYTKAA